MKLVLKNNDGDSVTLLINPNETFAQLKKRVEDEVGISVDMKDIAIKGKRIEDDQKVLDYFTAQYVDQQIRELSEQVCVVPGCTSTKLTNPDKSFFAFPQEEIRCHQWALYCQRLNMVSGKHRLDLTAESTICSDHFRPDQFVKNTSTLLKRTAVPCINPDLPVCDTFPPKRISCLPKNQKIDANIYKKVDCVSEPSYNKNNISTPEKEDNEIRDRMCRLCAQSSKDVIYIFDETGMKMGIADKIRTCLPVCVKENDLLPKQICKECYTELSNSYILATTCLNAEDKLNRLKQENHFRLKEGEEVGSPNDPKSTKENVTSSSEISSPEKKKDFVCPLCTEGKLAKAEGCEVQNGNGSIVSSSSLSSPQKESNSDLKEEQENKEDSNEDLSPVPDFC